MQVKRRSRGFHTPDTCKKHTIKTIISGKTNIYFFYLQLLIIPYADDRAKKIWKLLLCASEKEKYISGAADFGRQRDHTLPEKMESLYK